MTHPAHNHDIEGDIRVIELVHRLPPPLRITVVLLPLGTILGPAGHYDLQHLGLPLEPPLDQHVAEVHADVAAHADNRRKAKVASQSDYKSLLAIIPLPSIVSTRFSKCATRSATPSTSVVRGE